VLVPLAGAGAAAATLHERRRRRFGLAVAAASVVGLVATETVRHASAPPGIVWRDGTLQQMAEVSLASAGQLTLSPKARAFAVRGFEREDDVGDDDVDAPLRPRDLRFDVGRFGGAPHRMRALAARFVDDERLLVLRAAGDSMRLSVEPVDGAVADSGAAWTLRLPAMYAPQLTLDRVTGRWRVTGYSAERQLVTHTGIVGGAADGAAVPAGPLPGLPLYAAHGGAIYVASMSAVNALSGLRAVTGRMRWEMVRSRGGERRVIARLDGYPTCEGTGDGITVACTTVGAGRASIWRFTDDDEAVRPLARLPRGAYLQRVSPEGVVSALTIRGQAYVADVGARRGVRVRLPALGNEIAMDVQAAGEWLAVLRSRGGSGGRLVLYRMK